MAQVETSVPVKPLSVAGRALTTEETHVVRSPWDGAPIAAVSTVGARETKAGIDAAAEAVATPLPAFERAEVLDRGANALPGGRAGRAPRGPAAPAELPQGGGVARALLCGGGGPADEIGDVLVEDERVRMITFTGSAEVGWKLAERAAKKHVSLELGNSTPL